MLNIEETKKRQQILNGYIRNLSEKCYNIDEIQIITKQLEVLYKNGFRHQYSEFFPLLTEMEGEKKEYIVDFLLANLSEICNYIETQNEDSRLDDLYKSILKLKDHLNLEYARYCTNTANKEQMKDLEKQIKSSTTALREANTDYKSSKEQFMHVQHQLNDTTKKIRNIQTELIAVLSIFSAIVVTFSGSMSFIGGALQGMERAPFLKSVFFVSLCGFVVLNLIYLMMYLVSKITERNIYATCKTIDCTCENPCCGISKIRKRLPYIFWTNVMLLIFIIISSTPYIIRYILLIIPQIYKI